ncbi:MAG: hypothetical protein ABSG92_03580 [Conexivisphaerales archaeon]
MHRVGWFVIVLVVGVAAYLAVSLASPYFVTSSQSSGMMGAGGMMGWWTPFSGNQYSYPSLMWLIPLAALGLILVGAAGAVYSIVVPEIKTVKEASPDALPRSPVIAALGPSQNALGGTAPLPTASSSAEHPPSAMPRPSMENADAVLKTLKPDERRVVDVLRAHDGKYLQKWIVKETNMSRLQVHRVVARLVERNLVVAKAVGNTNEVSLVDWMKNRTE